jgi:hypothetical protein
MNTASSLRRANNEEVQLGVWETSEDSATLCRETCISHTKSDYCGTFGILIAYEDCFTAWLQLLESIANEINCPHFFPGKMREERLLGNSIVYIYL